MRSSKLSILPLAITLTAISVEAQSDSCSLCPFGENVGFPDKIIPGRDRTCEESSMLNIPEDSDECTEFRKSASWCGCPSTPQECFLCESGDSSPTPNQRSPLFPDTTCLDYEFLASQLTAEECPSLQQRAGSFDVSAYCQCDATEAPKVCELCPGGVLVNPNGFSVVPGSTCEQVDTGLLQYFTDRDLCIEFRQVLLANNLCECVGSTNYPTAAPTRTTEAPTKAPKTKEPKPTEAPTRSPTQAPTKYTKAPKATDAPKTTDAPVGDSQQSSPTGSPTASAPSSPSLLPTGGNPTSKGGTPVPTTSSGRTTAAPTRRSFKGSLTSAPSLAPVDLEGTGSSKGSGKGSSKGSSKSTKKETKLSNKGVEKKLKAKNKSKNTSIE